MNFPLLSGSFLNWNFCRTDERGREAGGGGGERRGITGLTRQELHNVTSIVSKVARGYRKRTHGKILLRTRVPLDETLL